MHRVTLSDYHMGETQVTQALWRVVMGAGPSSEWSWESRYGLGDNYPAYNVSYDECREFIGKLNELTGLTFRLPTEAEWEYAARGGSKSRHYTFSGSNTVDDVAWYGGNSRSKPHPVATKAPNEIGLYDMSGNLLEWCADWYGSSYYSSAAQVNPTGPAKGSYRVNRGGSWYDDAGLCRVAFRGHASSDARSLDLGLRLAL